jgi:hypothetical protein
MHLEEEVAQMQRSCMTLAAAAPVVTAVKAKQRRLSTLFVAQVSGN